MEQRGALSSMQALEQRSDEELEAETRHKAAAQALLGARAAERYDAKAARMHYQKAIAAARPQERMQLRRMADASLALAERRAGDLKVAVEKLGQEAPSNRQLLMLRFLGLLHSRARTRGTRFRWGRGLRVARIAGRYVPFGPYLALGIGIVLLYWNDVVGLLR